MGAKLNYTIHKLREYQDLVPKAAHWFQHTFGIPESTYRQSMQEMLEGNSPVPQWYVAVVGEEIVAGMGVIENDFHYRTDLTPNVCAVYTDEAYRGQGIARELLELVCRDMAEMGIDTLYLLTSHTWLYERYGWEYFDMADTHGGSPARVYRKITR